jgi:hypothetical protein
VENRKLNRKMGRREGAPCGTEIYCKPFSYQINNVEKETVTKVEGEEIVEENIKQMYWVYGMQWTCRGREVLPVGYE